MASIVKRGKTYSVVYYEGEGSNRHQVWESGLSYSAAKSRKATIEYEKEQNTHVDHNDISSQRSSLIIMEQRRMNMSKLTYIRCGDYDIPNLKLSVQPETSIGKYGRMRKSYLKEHRPILYNQLLMSEKLYPHLIEIDRTTQERMDTMLPHMMEAAGVTEELKACDPMRWVGLMNTLTAQIEEILIRELICS